MPKLTNQTGDPELSPKQTGPRTPGGKSRSSENAIKHGCRSEKTILRDEDPAEFDALIDGWFELYKPDNEIAIALVEETARAHWFLKRARHRLEEVEFNLPGNAYCWTDSQQSLYANFSRYKTTAERAFLRFYKETEAYYDKIFRKEQARERAFARLAAIEARFLSERAASQKANENRLVQWARIETQSWDPGVPNKTVTTLHPTNKELLERVKELGHLPFYVTRVLEFVHGVPPEYNWCNPTHMERLNFSCSVQNLYYRDWLRVLEHEAQSPSAISAPS